MRRRRPVKPKPQVVIDCINRLDEAGVASALAGWATSVRCLGSVSSTNDVARAWAPSAPHGSVVVADHQVGGRAGHGRTWWDEPGRSLLFSVVLHPPAQLLEEPTVLIVAATAALQGTLSSLGLRARLRWPTDVVIGCRKVGAVRGEVAGKAVIIGVGCNVHEPLIGFPSEFVATSIAAVTADEPDRVALLGLVLARFMAHYAVLVSGHNELVLDAYSQGLDTLGRRIRVAVGGAPVESTVVGIDQRGFLRLANGMTIASGHFDCLRSPWSAANAAARGVRLARRATAMPWESLIVIRRRRLHPAR